MLYFYIKKYNKYSRPFCMQEMYLFLLEVERHYFPTCFFLSSALCSLARYNIMLK